MSKKSRAKKSIAKKTRAAKSSVPRRSASKAARTATRTGARTSAKPARKPSPARSTRAATSTARDLTQQALDSLRFCAKYADDQLNALPDEHALSQLPGAVNHKAWTLGHQALSRAWFAFSLSGAMPSIPESYQSLFGMKSVPETDPAAYPPLEELRTNYHAAFDALVAAVERLTDADLLKPAHGDSGDWLTSKLDAVLKAAWHEGWHGGQVAALRRGLGHALPT